MQVRTGATGDFVQRYGIPVGWDLVCLDDLAMLRGGGTPARDDQRYWKGGDIPWVTPSDLTYQDSKWVSQSEEYLTQAGLSACPGGLLPKGTVLYTSRATIGAKAIAAVPVTTNQGFANFIPKARVSSDYLYYLLEILTPALKRLGSGTTFLEVAKRDTKKVQCAVPPTAEQQRIAAILDAVDGSITRTQEAIERAEELKRGIVQTLLSRGIGANGKIRPDEPATFQSSHLGRIPKDWEIVRLRDISDIGSGVTLGKDMSGFSSIELPYLRVANVQDGHLNLNEIKTVEVKTSEVDQYSLKWGDVVLTEGGDFDKLGRGTVWEAQIDPCLHQNHIFRVRPDQARLDPFYLAAVIGAEYGKRYFFRIAKRTTNLASINKTQLRAFPVPVPPLAEQQRIMEAIQGAGSEIERLKDILTQQQRLKRGLMQDLLTGHVRTVPVK